MREASRYIYGVHVGYVYDADTFKECVIDLGFHTRIHDQDFRLFGINAYEVKRNKSKKIGDDHVKKGISGRDAVRGLLAKCGNDVLIETIKKEKKGKFGRWLGIIWVPVQPIVSTSQSISTKINKLYIGGDAYFNLNQWLVQEGHAWEREY